MHRFVPVRIGGFSATLAIRNLVASGRLGDGYLFAVSANIANRTAFCGNKVKLSSAAAE